MPCRPTSIVPTGLTVPLAATPRIAPCFSKTSRSPPGHLHHGGLRDGADQRVGESDRDGIGDRREGADEQRTVAPSTAATTTENFTCRDLVRMGSPSGRPPSEMFNIVATVDPTESRPLDRSSGNR